MLSRLTYFSQLRRYVRESIYPILLFYPHPVDFGDRCMACRVWQSHRTQAANYIEGRFDGGSVIDIAHRNCFLRYAESKHVRASPP